MVKNGFLENRKPRLSTNIRARIIQIRVSKQQGRTLSLDRIMERLSYEKWDPLPSRGSIQNVVRQWEELPEELRLRLLPFDWSRLEDSGVPWESSELVLKCKREHDSIEQRMTPYVRVVRWGTFTNSEAKWCWRVHLAAPELSPLHVLTVAKDYNFRNVTTDFIQNGFLLGGNLRNSRSQADQIEQFLNGLLLYKPWLSRQSSREFVDNIEQGVLLWPTEWLGWTWYTYGLGAEIPEAYKNYLPPGLSRGELSSFPDPVFNRISPKNDVVKSMIAGGL